MPNEAKCPKCGQPLRIIARNLRTGKVLYSCRSSNCVYTEWRKEEPE